MNLDLDSLERAFRLSAETAYLRYQDNPTAENMLEDWWATHRWEYVLRLIRATSR